MIKLDELAIADVLRHKILGLVSFQPDIHMEYKEKDPIPIRDINGMLGFVLLQDCIETTVEEREKYWKIRNKS